jgi:hypothetical protein
MTWNIKSCPHCGGDTFLSKDVDNLWVENCLQCGYDDVKKKVYGKPQAIKPMRKKYLRQLVR